MWSSSSEEEAEAAPRAPETRQFDRAKLNVPLAETEVDLDDEAGVPLLAPAPEATTAAPLFPTGAKSKRNIVVLSSDEESEGSDEESEASDEEKEEPLDNTAPWSAEEDAKLRWLLESYQGMVDPWGMVAYDAFFLKARRSQRNVMQRAMELGLLDPSTELPEEEKNGSDGNVEKEKNKPNSDEEKEEKESDEEKEEEKESDREMEKEKEKKDAYSFEQRSEFIKTNLTRISQKVKVEKAVEILEPLLCLLERGITRRQTLKQKGEERVGGKSVRVTLPPSVPAQMRGQVALLLRSLRLQPTDTDVTIPSELAPQDFQQMLKVVETQVKRWKYQLNRKANKKRVASEEEEEEVKTKKRRVVVDDSDLRVC